jgi:hypothetical protein
LGVD